MHKLTSDQEEEEEVLFFFRINSAADLLWVLRSTGRALEELRSSLYNEMHSSEGAKRQQQRFCGPPVALTFNFAVAVGIIVANKMVTHLCVFFCLR